MRSSDLYVLWDPRDNPATANWLLTHLRDKSMWLGDRSKSLLIRLLPVPSCPLKSPT